MNVYWDRRVGNVFENIKNILSHDIVERIILFNNNSSLSLRYPDVRVTTINCSFNFGYRSAFIASLLYSSSCYFLIDDDVTVSRGTLENFCDRMRGDIVLGYHGKLLSDGDYPYTEPQKVIEGDKLKRSEKADVLVGNGGLCFTRKCIINMLDSELGLISPSYDESRELDLLLTYTNRCYVIPCTEDQRLIGMPEYGVGYHRGKGHYEKRDNIINLLRRRIK